MIHFSNKNNELFFGLDISDQSLKIVQLKRHSDKTKMQAFGKYRLKKDIISDGEIKNNKDLIQAIKTLISKPTFGNINTSNVVASLPESKSFIKLISVENSPNQISDLISTEIEKFFPFSINDLYFDWQIMNKYPEYTDILVSASPKNLVNSYIDVLQEVGLTVLAMETESVALCRCLIPDISSKAKTKDTTNYAIIDIGAVESTMIIYSSNSIIMSMSIDVSGEEITENIASTLEITHSQAEKAKIICGLDKTKAEGIIHDILIKKTLKMAKRIQDILDFYQDHYPDYGAISKIFISGGGSNIKNLKNIISNFIKIEVLDGDVFLKINEKSSKYNKKLTETHNLEYGLLKNNKKKQKEPETISSRHNSSLNYATAIGLALRNV